MTVWKQVPGLEDYVNWVGVTPKMEAALNLGILSMTNIIFI